MNASDIPTAKYQLPTAAPQVFTSSYINPGAPVYVLAGNGGAGFSVYFDLQAFNASNTKYYSGVPNSYIINWNENINGYLSFIAGPTSLSMQAIDDRTGQVRVVLCLGSAVPP